jgi:hypothetical protein
VAQTPRHPMPIHRTANGFGNDEAHSGNLVTYDGGSARMHHDIRLRGSHSVLDGVTEVRRPCHPVLSRQHWSPDPWVRQSASDGPCDAGPSQWRGRHGCASAAGNHGLWPGAGYWAGRCACPWPRLSPRHFWQPRSLNDLCIPATGLPLLSSVEPARYRALPVAAVSPTFGRLFEGTEVACAGQTAPIGTLAARAPAGHPACWHPARNLLASPQGTDW